jgi:hypothetical protein
VTLGRALLRWYMRWLHDNGPQDLITVSLCIKIAINKMLIVFIVCSLCLPAHTITLPPWSTLKNVHQCWH